MGEDGTIAEVGSARPDAAADQAATSGFDFGLFAVLAAVLAFVIVTNLWLRKRAGEDDAS